MRIGLYSVDNRGSDAKRLQRSRLKKLVLFSRILSARFQRVHFYTGLPLIVLFLELGKHFRYRFNLCLL